ncbi:MAG: hypothetical protein Q4E88_02825 [Coriobacteriia bacterium]|nr:hypothetical protein [Coriobacteriia bacterium]
MEDLKYKKKWESLKRYVDESLKFYGSGNFRDTDRKYDVYKTIRMVIKDLEDECNV